jgi:hypothetical protein
MFRFDWDLFFYRDILCLVDTGLLELIKLRHKFTVLGFILLLLLFYLILIDLLLLILLHPFDEDIKSHLILDLLLRLGTTFWI